MDRIWGSGLGVGGWEFGLGCERVILLITLRGRRKSGTGFWEGRELDWIGANFIINQTFHRLYLSTVTNVAHSYSSAQLSSAP